MTYETYKTVLQALANAHPCNTSSDFSVSIKCRSWNGVERYSLVIFPSEFFPFWTVSALVILLGISQVYDVHLSMNVNNGVVTAHLD